MLRLLGFFMLLFSYCAADEIPPFALITMPKSGSHLMIKALHMMTGSEPIWHTRFPSYQYIPADEGFLYTHFCVSPELEKDYSELKDLRKMILIRDLRDVAISIVNQIKRSPWPGHVGQDRIDFLNMSFDEQLLFVINYEYDVKAIAHKAPNSLQVSLIRVAEQALHYSQRPDILTFRYEDLVGPNGGGSGEAQIAQLHRIKSCLQLDISEESLCAIASKLYGDAVNPFGKGEFKNYQSTFHVGTVGRWKEVFRDEHKEAFKKKLGRFLIALGYEQNENW